MTPMPQLPTDIQDTVHRALQEDIGSGDITAELIPADTQATANVICREPAVLCGMAWVNQIFTQLDPSVSLQWNKADGDQLTANEPILQLSGNARSLLTGERCALNFLQTLSATATISHRLAGMVAHTKVKLLDTRKTLPGLRSAQKYAVLQGGCFNHRLGLFDAFLIKENHISTCGGIAKAIEKARQLAPGKPVEVEVESMDQLQQALHCVADIIMLDNFSLDQLSQAVAINANRVKLEASGGIDENTLVKVAETGVDFISIGALTKDIKAVDLSMIID